MQRPQMIVEVQRRKVPKLINLDDD